MMRVGGPHPYAGGPLPPRVGITFTAADDVAPLGGGGCDVCTCDAVFSPGVSGESSGVDELGEVTRSELSVLVRRYSLGLTPRVRLNAALNPNASE